jgi:hypothetical protein
MLLTTSLCLAIATYHESRSATIQEQQEIVQVIDNRARIQHVNACTVALDSRQFSYAKHFKRKTKFNTYNDMLRYYKITDGNAWVIALGVVNYKPYPNDILFYHDKSIKRFKFNHGQLAVAKVTKHFVFYKEV